MRDDTWLDADDWTAEPTTPRTPPVAQTNEPFIGAPPTGHSGRRIALVVAFALVGCLIAVWWLFFLGTAFGMNHGTDLTDVTRYLFRVAVTIAYLYSVRKVFF